MAENEYVAEFSRQEADKIVISGFTSDYLKNWNMDNRVHVNCANIHLLNGMMATYEMSHRKYVEMLKQEDKSAAELIQLKELLLEKRTQAFWALSSLNDAIGSVEKAITKLLEHQAYSHGYSNAESDLAPLNNCKGGMQE